MLKRQILLTLVLSLSTTILLGQTLSPRDTGSQLDKKTDLILASNHAPPGVIFEDGKISGFQVVMAEGIAKRMGLNLRVFKCPWLRCLRLAGDGYVDLLGEVTRNEEREKTLRFLNPSYRLFTNEAFYARKGSHLSVKRFEELQGLSVGVVLGYKYFARFDDDKLLNKVRAQGEEQLIRMLIGNRIDVFFANESLADYLLNHSDYRNQIVKLEYSVRLPLTSNLAMSRQSPLMERWDELHRAYNGMLADPDIRELLSDYLGEQLVPIQELGLEPETDD